MRPSVIKKAGGEDIQDVIARMELDHPELKRSTLIASVPKTLRQMFGRKRTEAMRREAAGRSRGLPDS